MTSPQELFAIAEKMDTEASSPALAEAEGILQALETSASEAGRAFSGSWLGYHANVYYLDLAPPPPGALFSQEWGLKDMSYTSFGSRGDWCIFDPKELEQEIRSNAGNPDLSAVVNAAQSAAKAFAASRSEVESILHTELADRDDGFLEQLCSSVKKLEALSPTDIANIWAPSGQIFTRDTTAAGQGTKIPPHFKIKAEIASIKHTFAICAELSDLCRKAASHIERQGKRRVREARVGTNVFIGHGRSLVWREVKDFVQDRLHLPWDEFNRVPVAGVTNQARLSEMLDAAAMAIVIMTAEDESAEGELQARMNVIHEVGLFQGRLGFTRAIVLLEDGCAEFSNIQGLGQIRFPRNNVGASFEDIRLVMEREGLIAG